MSKVSIFDPDDPNVTVTPVAGPDAAVSLSHPLHILYSGTDAGSEV